VPATNTNRFPVVFALRATTCSVPALLPAMPVLSDPLIVTLTYFRRPGTGGRWVWGGGLRIQQP
jgi:hypothetical protein